MRDDTPRADEEHLGWRMLRLPPSGALAFGAVYGAVVGAFIAWDVVVLVRLGKILNRRISEKMEERRQRNE